jgi:hypothetical protein
MTACSFMGSYLLFFAIRLTDASVNPHRFIR